jgi:hypothetical protein
MTSTQTARAKHTPRKVGRWDFIAAGFAFVTVAIAAFAPGLLNGAHRTAPLTLAVAAHALLFTAWVLVFLVQATLIATGRTALHRRLGSASIGLAALMIITGYRTAIALARRGFDLSGDLHLSDAVMSAVFPLGDLVSFAILFSAGVWHRGRPEKHKRLMLLATIGMMMPASVAHFVGHNFPDIPALVPVLLGLLFSTPAIYDRIRFGRFHPVTLWGGILLFVWGNLRAVVIGPSAEWKQLMSWLISQ